MHLVTPFTVRNVRVDGSKSIFGRLLSRALARLSRGIGIEEPEGKD